MADEDNSYWPYIHETCKGVFYRASCKKPKILLGSMLGAGTYVTWERGMAEVFGKMMCGKDAVIEEYQIPVNLRLLGAHSEAMREIKSKYGINTYDNFDDKLLTHLVTEDIKKLGYDGAISSQKQEGLVIYDQTKIKRLK